MRKSILLVVLIGILLVINSLLVAGVSIDKYKLEFVVDAGSLSTQNLTIWNTESGPFKYELLIKGDYAEWFSFSDNDFILYQNQQKEASITVSPPEDIPANNYTTKIGVLSQPINTTGFAIAQGILIQTKIIVHEPKQSSKYLIFTIISLFIVIIILVIVAIFLALTYTKKNKSQYIPRENEDQQLFT